MYIVVAGKSFTVLICRSTPSSTAKSGAGKRTDLDQHLDLGLRVRLEELGERLLDVGPATDQLAVGIGAFALLGPLGGDGLGIALVECGGEIAGLGPDRLGVGFPALIGSAAFSPRSMTGGKMKAMARAAIKPPVKIATVSSA